MGLSDLPIGAYYRSGSEDIVADFYVPCLSVANSYDRAVGYFTSTSLAAAARGLRAFIERPDTQMRLIASPALTAEDAQAITAGYEIREVVDRAISRELLEPVPDAITQRLQLLTWLIAHHRLEIKLAVVTLRQAVGIYHEKLGIFRDYENAIIFTGSSNESASGLIVNFESVEVFRSWKDGERERVERRIRDFNDLWNNCTNGLEVLTFPEAAKKQLLERYRPPEEVTFLDDGSHYPPALDRPTLQRPQSIELREYQKDAIKAWWSANGRGIWEMATGTGKTITALSAAAALWDTRKHKESLLVIITVPFRHLAEQWASEVRRFGARPILAYDSEKWISAFEATITSLSLSDPRVAVVIAVNRTFCSPRFQDCLRMSSCTTLLISDEVHTAGSTSMRAALPPGARYRLGLSATPERHLDPTGTAALREYFGESVYKLDLKRAIQLEALVPYRYHPIVVQLTESEHEEYIEITEKISRALAVNGDIDPDDPPEGVDLLLFRRARLIGSAANKLPALIEAITPHIHETHILIYCADRSGEDPQLDQVLRALGSGLRMRINTFTAEEDMATRTELLSRFSSGELQALAAIRCLDEGVDIPATRRAYILASSQNPRQFVQRRGRVLRRAPGKVDADIYDFLVSPPDLSDDPSLYRLERRLVGRELMRAVELCDASMNRIDALSALRPLRARYDLLSLGLGESNEEADGVNM